MTTFTLCITGATRSLKNSSRGQHNQVTVTPLEGNCCTLTDKFSFTSEKEETDHNFT